jgi:hypothetical protein
MKNIILLFTSTVIILLAGSCLNDTASSRIPKTYTITKSQLLNKIKGGWAGQTIGCTYGGPTEFHYNGTMIQDYVPVNYPDGYIKHWYEHTPGLYDDIYMDLTFVDVFARLGINAPVDSLAMAFATAGYTLWHANQSARYNILNGIMPPHSGHWLNNPHADDIDYQIEADYAGIMSPGMPNSASEISDKVGHIMNYGDGWYGGVYVGAIYTLAFISDDIEFIVTEALKTIPEQSTYYKCMHDVIEWHKQFPDDWKRTWFECERKWSSDIGCPDGVFVPFNIDAVINSAYILIGLLYGDGDFYRTMDIATRCGQDSDCNPASAAGILGVILGYDNIPEYWMKNLRVVENINFAYTDISLNKAYQMSFNQAIQMIERGGGSIDDENVTIVCQQPISVNYEKSFDGLYPVENRELRKKITDIGEFTFAGTGVVFRGNVSSGGGRNNFTSAKNANYIAKVLVSMDGKEIETVNLPIDYRIRRNEIFWKYQLPSQVHTVTFEWLNPEDGISVNFRDAIIYSDKPYLNNHQSNKN